MAALADKVLRDKGYDFSIREDQMRVISSILESKDTFAIFPTGFGKSLTYVLPPLILNESHPDVPHMSLVVSPLTSLIEDQVQNLNEHNIKATPIYGNSTPVHMKDIKDGKSVVVLATPEAVLSKQWRSTILEARKYICMVAYDEAHCISEWGLDFREEYCKIGLLQSIIEAPVLALSATVTKEVKRDIDRVLGLSINTVLIATLPDRPNILIDIRKCSEKFEEELEWVGEAVKKHGKACMKIIIYVNSISACEGIYIWLHSTLCEKAYCEDVSIKNRLIEMYHASTDKESKARIMESFRSPEGSVRVLIATVACGMGMDIPDIAVCVLWGLPPSMMQLWQEIGRCGRDGRDSLAVCFAFPRSISLPCQRCRSNRTHKCSCEARQHMRDLTSTKQCYRAHCLEAFKLEKINTCNTNTDANKNRNTCTSCERLCKCHLCKCCTNCSEKCLCPSKITKENVVTKFLPQ